jgi:two-component system sensor histidine kinase DesK
MSLNDAPTEERRMAFNLIARWFTPAPDSGFANDVRQGDNPWANSVHLLWSLWIFITPMFERGLSGYTREWLIATVITYPIFLFLFIKVQLVGRRHVLWFPLGMIALCFASMPWFPSGMSYLVFGCIMLYHCRMSRRKYMAALVVINSIFIGLALWIGYPVVLLVIMPGTVFIICTIVMVENISKERNAMLALSQDEVRRLAALAERERIGRDLHDLLGHTLSLITLKLELSRKLFDRDSEAARREMEEAETVARHALAEVRSAVSGIRATDLAAELASARLLLESSRVHFEYGTLPTDLPGDIERGFSLIVREAATNIARHAEASSARVEITREHASVRMLISDNGRGGIDADGNGLCGMRERVRALGAILVIESPRGQGTRLRITAPVPILRLVESSRAPTDPSFDAVSDSHVAGNPAA